MLMTNVGGEMGLHRGAGYVTSCAMEDDQDIQIWIYPDSVTSRTLYQMKSSLVLALLYLFTIESFSVATINFLPALGW